MMSNRRNGTLYTGVTVDIVRRAHQHKSGIGSSFVKRYGLTRLVYFDPHAEIARAIQRETNIKYWPRAWKVRLLETLNPEWVDLYPTLI
jgi:putative endonuclease